MNDIQTISTLALRRDWIFVPGKEVTPFCVLCVFVLHLISLDTKQLTRSRQPLSLLHVTYPPSLTY